MSYNNRVQQRRSNIPVYHKKSGKVVAVVSYESDVGQYITAGGNEKKLRLFIDDKEVDLTPPRKEELTLVAEKKQMMASMTQSVKPKSNRFACLDDSESDDDTDTIVTPKKSWATVTTPSAPEKFPPPAKLVRQVANVFPKKLDFPPMNTRGAALNKTPTTGVWAKGLKTAVKEKHGSIGAWCAAPQGTTDQFLKAQQTTLRTELEKMRRECDTLQAKLKDMIEAEETETDEETHTSLKNIVDKYEGMSWADINEMDDNSAW